MNGHCVSPFFKHPELKKIIFLHRHGARGPAGGEISAFSGNGNSCPIFQEWKETEIDTITNVGHDQMHALGRWFSDRYLHTGFTERGKWLASSLSERALESGSDFTQEINRLHHNSIFPAHPDDFETDKSITADHVFRPWRINDEYLSLQQQMIKSDSWTQKAAEMHDFMDELYTKLQCPLISQSDNVKLLNLTQVYSMSECEVNSDPDNRKNEMLSRVTAYDLSVLEHVARWVWSRRFLMSQCGDLIGGHLANIVMNDLSGSHCLCVYSAHDYTILSLLTAIGVWLNSDYPSPVLGFGSYLLFEVHLDGRIFLKLNPKPFLTDDLQVHEENTVTLLEWPSEACATTAFRACLASQEIARNNNSV